MSGEIVAAFCGCTHPHIFPRIELLANEPGVRLAGCYDPDVRLSAALEREHGLRAFGSAEELVDQPGVNFVVIEGWDPDNPGYVRQAIRRDQAVLLEKPGAPNLPAMRVMLDDLRGHPVPFQIGYQLRHSPVLPHVRRIQSEGVLGPITLVRTHAAAPVGGAAEPWQSVPGDLGGLLYTDGCHMLDLIVHLHGAPRRVVGTTLTLPAGPPVLAHGYKRDTLLVKGETVEIPLGGLMYEDAAAAVLHYGDKLATFDITGWEAHPWVEAWRMEFYGTDGTLYVGLEPPPYRLYVRNPRAGYEAGWHDWQAHKSGSGVDATYTGEMAEMLNRVRAWDTDNARWLAETEAVFVILDEVFRQAKADSTISGSSVS
jgi:predicted dehydrogenase